ncbi:MAG: hypothetical protein HS113_23115 [Verrucomicrobiales bacterium]|nr:hypothetical protein [Verrucomicrobiales bacterium]
MEQIERGTLFPYAGAAEVYRCPSDTSFLPRQQREWSPFNCALSSFLNGLRPNGQSVDAWVTANRGFAGSQEPRFRTVQKLGHVLRPSEVFTFADHQGFPLHGHYPLAPGIHLRIEPLTDRHHQGATLSFADGHADC